MLVIETMNRRIEAKSEYIETMISKRADGVPFWHDKESYAGINNEMKFRVIPRFYMVWDSSFLSPYEWIEDSQNRIRELENVN